MRLGGVGEVGLCREGRGEIDGSVFSELRRKTRID